MSAIELEKEKVGVYNDLILQFTKLKSSGKSNSHELREKKKNLARIETIISEKLIEEMES